MEQHNSLKEEIERYSIIRKYYEENQDRLTPKNEEYLLNIIQRENDLFNFLKLKNLIKSKKENLKNKNASKTRINK